jgi:hypothetical protein
LLAPNPEAKIQTYVAKPGLPITTVHWPIPSLLLPPHCSVPSILTFLTQSTVASLQAQAQQEGQSSQPADQLWDLEQTSPRHLLWFYPSLQTPSGPLALPVAGRQEENPSWKEASGQQQHLPSRQRELVTDALAWSAAKALQQCGQEQGFQKGKTHKQKTERPMLPRPHSQEGPLPAIASAASKQHRGTALGQPQSRSCHGFH